MNNFAFVAVSNFNFTDTIYHNFYVNTVAQGGHRHFSMAQKCKFL